MAVCSVKCIDLRNEAMKKIIYFKYSSVLNLWRMRNLRLKGRIVVFKMFETI